MVCRYISHWFIILKSAPRMQHDRKYLCVKPEGDHIKTRRHLCMDILGCYQFLAESVSGRPGHVTISHTHMPSSKPDPMFLSTNGHSAVVDLWPLCDSGKQIWAAARSPQNPNHWTFTVGGGNTQDSSRIQLSCGLADKAGELVDLWSEHKWELQPLLAMSQSSGGDGTRYVLPTVKVWQPCLFTHLLGYLPRLITSPMWNSQGLEMTLAASFGKPVEQLSQVKQLGTCQ